MKVIMEYIYKVILYLDVSSQTYYIINKNEKKIIRKTR